MMKKINKYLTKNIFISSTFVDMQLERDILSKRVLPLVKEHALKYHLNIEFVDLRFGIDIGNENLMDKVISTCSDEIDRCKPLFIAFLGNRYGTKIENSDDSITSMEIKHAINNDCECLYYFRNIVNSDELGDDFNKYFSLNEEVDWLKNNLRKKYPDKCKDYYANYNKESRELSIENNFINQLICDINNLIDSLYKNEIINNVSSQMEYLSYINKDYVDIDNNLIARLIKPFDYNEKLILLYGEPGSGKSMILSDLVKKLDENYFVIPYFCNATCEDNSVINVLNSLIESMSNELNIEYEIVSDLNIAINTFYSLLSKISRDTIIVLDEFDQINDNNKDEKFIWIRTSDIPSNIKFIISTNSKGDTNKLKLDSHIVNLNSLNKNKIKIFLDNYLLRINQKVSNDFYNALLSELVQKTENKTLFHLKTYLDYVFYNDRYDANVINELSLTNNDEHLSGVDRGVNDFYINKIMNMDEDISNLISKLFEKKLELFDAKLANAILFLISSSAYGLREEDLKGICEILNINYVSSEFAYMRKVMSSYFYQQSNGAWKFSSELIKNTFKNYYIKDNSYSLMMKKAFLEYLSNLDNNDEIKQTNIIQLLYINKKYEDIKLVLEYMLENNSHHLEMIKYFLIFSIFNDDELLFVLLNNDNEDLAYFIGSKVLPLIYKIDVDLVYQLIYKLSSENKSKTNSLKYIFTQILAIICLEYGNDSRFDLIRQNFYSLHFESKNEKIKNNIIDFYFAAIGKYQDDKEKVEELVIEVTRLIKRSINKDKLYYGNLCRAYLEYVKLHKDNYKLINDHIKYIIKFINDDYADYTVKNEFIDLMFELFVIEYYKDNYIKANKYINIITKISDNYRYEERSINAILKALIMKYYTLIIHQKRRILKINEIDLLIKEFTDLNIKSHSNIAKNYILALNQLKILVSLNSYDLLIDYEKLIREQKNLLVKSKYSILELYSLLYSSIEYMAIIHHNRDTLPNSISLDGKLGLYKDIYDLFKDKYSNDLLIKMYEKEILFYISMLENSSNKVNYLKREIELSIEIFKDKKTEISIMSLINDCFFYKDFCIEKGNYIEAINKIKKVKDCIDYYNYCTSIMLYKEKALLEAYEMTLNFKSDIYSSYNNLNKIFSYIKNVEKQDINLVLTACLDALDVVLSEINVSHNEDYKRLFNKIYDEIYKYIPDYLINNGYKKFEVKASKEINERSSKEDLLKYYNENLDKSSSFDEVENLLNLDTNEGYIITYEDNDVSYDELEDLRFTEKYLNRYDRFVKAKDSLEFWRIQLNKGYIIGFYNIAYLYEKNQHFDEAIKIYEDGAKHGCLACMDALGHFYPQLGRDEEAYQYLINAAKKGYLYSIEKLLKNYKDRLYEDDMFKDLMIPLYNNLMSFGNGKINQEVLVLTKICIEQGELNVENHQWFLKYYNYLTKVRNGNIVKYLPIKINEYNKDEITLFNLRKKAIINNDVEAMSRLAYHYFKGDIVNVDYIKGLYWATTATNNKNYSMCFYTGMLLYTGDSTLDIDYEKAALFLLFSYLYADGKKQGVEPTLKHIYDNKLCSEKTLNLIKNYIKF